MDLNLVVVSGRLAAPPEIRQFESGSRLARVRRFHLGLARARLQIS